MLNDLRCFRFDHIGALSFIHHTSRLTERKTTFRLRWSISTVWDGMKIAAESDCINVITAPVITFMPNFICQGGEIFLSAEMADERPTLASSRGVSYVF